MSTLIDGRPVTTQTRIRHLLARSPLSIAQLAARLGLSHVTVQQALKTLRDQQVVVGEGSRMERTYRLVAGPS